MTQSNSKSDWPDIVLAALLVLLLMNNLPEGSLVNKPPMPKPGVLVIYESSQQLSSGQTAALNSLDWTQHLESRGIPWHRFDVNDDLSRLDPMWQTAGDRQRLELPWVVLSTGSSGTEEVLPDSSKAMTELVRRYFP